MSDEALARLVSLRHGNPHSVLGAHQTPTDVFVRVFRPEAFRVEIEALGKKHTLKPRPDFPGIFEGRLPTKEIPSYIVHVDYPGGASFTLRDPYTFVPTLGAADLHFVGEGTHRRLWERLGAHPMQHQGVFGTSFVVYKSIGRQATATTTQAMSAEDSNKLIARQLDIAETTVKVHVQGILRKLQLSSRVQAAVYAAAHGLV